MGDNKIRVLGLEACSLTDVAAVLLAYTVRRNNSLAHIDVHGNWFGIGVKCSVQCVRCEV
jgi:hypothetical protein